MKKITSIALALLLLIGLMGTLPVYAAGSATISASKSSVTVGQQVTVTAKYAGGSAGIGSLDAYFYYNTKAFEYVSCSGATAAGGAGTIKISYFCQDVTAPKTVTVSVTLKAVGVGNGNFKWETEGMYSDNDDLLGTPGKSLSVSVTNPTKSGDATLSFLKPSKGTLSPKFDKNVTNYTVTVPYSVTRCLLNYGTTDPQAQTAVAGSANLKVGKNTRSVTVTAQNGTTKKYTVVITREPATDTDNTTSSSGSTTSTTAPTAPPKDTLEVTVGDKAMYVAESQTTEKLPTNFDWDFITVNGVDVPAGKHKNADLTVLYLLEKEGDGGAFYLYDPATETFAPYYKLSLKSAVYTVHSLPQGSVAPAGTKEGTFTYKDVQVSAFLYEDEALKDFAILQVTTPEGKTGLYVFDSAEKAFLRYVAPTEGVATPQKDTNTPAVILEEEKSGGIAAFFREYQQVLLISTAAVAALALLIIGIVLVVRMSGGGNKGKH
ncbi:MAG: cadherin-like beta sandwich domain-containing protein [Ruminococcaceae bacterium]|nr:cadherin-like beta sandwich domain-containing protein [Oscillospiraceae bacterium]